MAQDPVLCFMKGKAVNGVDDKRNVVLSGGKTPQKTPFGVVSVDQIEFLSCKQAVQLPQGVKILERRQLADKVSDGVKLHAGLANQRF